MTQSRVTPAAAAMTAIAQSGGTDVAGSIGPGNTTLDEFPAEIGQQVQSVSHGQLFVVSLTDFLKAFFQDFVKVKIEAYYIIFYYNSYHAINLVSRVFFFVGLIS